MDILREVLLPKLESVKFSHGSWMARCPAHDDREASLHISRGTKHPVVLTCHATCERDDILGAVGLTWSDLCAERQERPQQGEWTPRGPALAVYDYTDEAGKLLFQVLRTAGKQFPQRVPDSSRKSGWRWSLEDTRRVLYRLPKILEAVKDGELIYVCEGEKDVHAIERAGAFATCNPGGAGKWRPEYAECLRDAIVRIVADTDKPGRAHARQVAATLEGVAAGVEIVEAATGKDAADHLGAGRDLAAFIVTKDGGIAEPELAPDLHDFLAGEDPPIHWVIPGLLERGDRLIWTGEEGRGKSMAVRQFAIAAAAGIQPFTDVICPPQKVLFIDCENPERKSRRHFRKLEYIARCAKQRRVPPGGFRIIHRPESVNLGSEEEAAWLVERVTAHKPDLLVIGPLYKLHALDINDEQAARAIVRVIDQTRAVCDCAVIIEAHAPHGTEGSRTMRPFGSSLFLRWPEFGYGIRIAPAKGDRKQTRKRVSVVPWRGPRDERDWPKELIWGNPDRDWPWVVPTDPPSLEVLEGGA